MIFQTPDCLDYSPIADNASTSEFWSLYKTAKGKRNSFQSNPEIGPQIPEERKKIVNNYDLYANVTSANIFLQYFANTSEFQFTSLTWEFHLTKPNNCANSNAKEIYKRNVTSLETLSKKAGGDENLTSYTKYNLMELIKNNSINSFKFLDGTNFGLRFLDFEKKENYIVIPFRCFQYFFLFKCLNQATVSKKDPNHDKSPDDKRIFECDIKNDFGFLQNKLNNSYLKAKKVLLPKYLPC